MLGPEHEKPMGCFWPEGLRKKSPGAFTDSERMEPVQFGRPTYVDVCVCVYTLAHSFACVSSTRYFVLFGRK